jgi:hypothetical protein
LTWSDLLIEDFDRDRATALLDLWGWLVGDEAEPVVLSKFGDWFLRRPDGRTEMLDVLEGTLSTVAGSPGEFEDRVNDPGWRDEYLLPALIAELHRRDKVPGPGQCYALIPLPREGGRFEPEFILVADLALWQAICAHSARPAEGRTARAWW